MSAPKCHRVPACDLGSALPAARLARPAPPPAGSARHASARLPLLGRPRRHGPPLQRPHLAPADKRTRRPNQSRPAVLRRLRPRSLRGTYNIATAASTAWETHRYTSTLLTFSCALRRHTCELPATAIHQRHCTTAVHCRTGRLDKDGHSRRRTGASSWTTSTPASAGADATRRRKNDVFSCFIVARAMVCSVMC